MNTTTDYPGRSGPLAHDAPWRNHGYSGLDCGCNPAYSQSCERCDGTRSTSGGQVGVVPPCMKPGWRSPLSDAELAADRIGGPTDARLDAWGCPPPADSEGGERRG